MRADRYRRAGRRDRQKSSCSRPVALADVPLTVRLSAMAVGFAAFVLVRRSVLVGVLAGEAVLILGAFWFAG